MNSIVPNPTFQGGQNSMFDWLQGGAWQNQQAQGQPGFDMSQALTSGHGGYMPQGGPGVPGTPQGGIFSRGMDWINNNPDSMTSINGILGSATNVWDAFNTWNSNKDMNKRFNKQFNLQSDLAKTNVNNQVGDYNRRLEGNWANMEKYGNTRGYNSWDEYSAAHGLKPWT